MTKLMYRGAEHGGVIETKARMPADLIYRGQAHTGMPQTKPVLQAETLLQYRGIAYRKTGAGIVPLAAKGAAVSRPHNLAAQLA